MVWRRRRISYIRICRKWRIVVHCTTLVCGNIRIQHDVRLRLRGRRRRTIIINILTRRPRIGGDPMVTRILMSVFALCASAHAGYILAIKSNEPASLELSAQAPSDTIIVDYAVWRDVPADYKQYNPAQYPTVIDPASGVQVQQPESWSNAVAVLIASRWTTDQQADIAACQQELGAILYSFGISLPVRPKEAIDAMIEAAGTLDELKAANKALALYTRLRVEYGFSDAEIGGVE